MIFKECSFFNINYNKIGLIQCNSINQNLNISYCGFLNIFTQYSLASTIHCEPCNICYVKYICFYNCTAYVPGLLCGRALQVKTLTTEYLNSFFCKTGHLFLFSTTNSLNCGNFNSTYISGGTSGIHFHPFINDGTVFNYHIIKNSNSADIFNNNGEPIIVRLKFVSIINNTVSYVFKSTKSSTQYLTDIKIIKYHPNIFFGSITRYLTRFYLDISFIGYSIPENCIITHEFSFQDPNEFNILLCRFYEDKIFHSFSNIVIFKKLIFLLNIILINY